MTGPECDGTILKAAQADRDHVARLLATHKDECAEPGCDSCLSLQAHLDRTERQVSLLTPPEYDEESLF